MPNLDLLVIPHKINKEELFTVLVGKMAKKQHYISCQRSKKVQNVFKNIVQLNRSEINCYLCKRYYYNHKRIIVKNYKSPRVTDAEI